jgi:hypothetical protein
MPNVVVDLSARSRHIREEPWQLHFWENTVPETLEYLRDPRGFLERIGVKLPEDCRIETVIENHDWMSRETSRLEEDTGPICNVGGGNTAKDFYRVSMYAHRAEDVGRFEKDLLHSTEEEQVGEAGGSFRKPAGSG